MLLVDVYGDKMMMMMHDADDAIKAGYSVL